MLKKSCTEKDLTSYIDAIFAEKHENEVRSSRKWAQVFEILKLRNEVAFFRPRMRECFKTTSNVINMSVNKSLKSGKHIFTISLPIRCRPATLLLTRRLPFTRCSKRGLDVGGKPYHRAEITYPPQVNCVRLLKKVTPYTLLYVHYFMYIPAGNGSCTTNCKNKTSICVRWRGG